MIDTNYFLIYVLIMNFFLSQLFIMAYRVIEIVKTFEIKDSKQVYDLFFCDYFDSLRYAEKHNIKFSRKLLHKKMGADGIGLYVFVGATIGFAAIPIWIAFSIVTYTLKYLLRIFVSLLFLFFKKEKE